jgi:hypothetical protein
MGIPRFRFLGGWVAPFGYRLQGLLRPPAGFQDRGDRCCRASDQSASGLGARHSAGEV